MADVTIQRTEAQASGWTVGFAIFAGAMMFMAGVFQAFEGLAAIFNGNFFVVGANYAFSIDVATWGWVHLIGGIVVAFAGIAVFSGQAWARVLGIILAIISATINFFFIPYYPFWTLLIIGLDIAVIAALAAYTPEAARTASYY
jgi:hypothetical protein